MLICLNGAEWNYHNQCFDKYVFINPNYQRLFDNKMAFKAAEENFDQRLSPNTIKFMNVLIVVDKQ